MTFHSLGQELKTQMPKEQAEMAGGVPPAQGAVLLSTHTPLARESQTVPVLRDALSLGFASPQCIRAMPTSTSKRWGQCGPSVIMADRRAHAPAAAKLHP